MVRLPSTSRDLVALHVAEQRARQTRPAVAPRPVSPGRAAHGRTGALPRLLRRLWRWVEQPEATVPPSRPLATNFYTEL